MGFSCCMNFENKLRSRIKKAFKIPYRIYGLDYFLADSQGNKAYDCEQITKVTNIIIWFDKNATTNKEYPDVDFNCKHKLPKIIYSKNGIDISLITTPQTLTFNVVNQDKAKWNRLSYPKVIFDKETALKEIIKRLENNELKTVYGESFI